MGMYDSILVPCPNCGEVSEFQSKGGDCLLNEYTLENCPQDVLSDVNRHSPNKCKKCNTEFSVTIRDVTILIGTPVVVKKGVKNEN